MAVRYEHSHCLLSQEAFGKITVKACTQLLIGMGLTLKHKCPLLLLAV